MSEREAGREMDAEIAEHVMGLVPRDVRVRGEVDTPLVRIFVDSPYWDNADGRHDRAYLTTFGGPPPYSTDIAAAWTVVEKLMERFFSVNVNVNHESGYTCCIDMREKWAVSADTAPLAICRAALSADVFAAHPEGGE